MHRKVHYILICIEMYVFIRTEL